MKYPVPLEAVTRVNLAMVAILGVLALVLLMVAQMLGGISTALELVRVPPVAETPGARE